MAEPWVLGSGRSKLSHQHQPQAHPRRIAVARSCASSPLTALIHFTQLGPGLRASTAPIEVPKVVFPHPGMRLAVLVFQ